MGRILIADDEINILGVLTEVLENAGHEVVGAPDGNEALFQLQSKKFDVALLDVMMPKIDGYHLAQAIHSLPQPPKIIIMTSRDFDGDQQALVGTGALAFLSKPFSNKDVLEAVSKLLIA